MDIVDFWEKQVSKWNNENKCGFCWDFHAPLIESQIGVVQLEEGKECCVQVMITDISFSENITYNKVTRLITDKYCDWSFKLYVLKQSDIGLNYYNEIKGHDTTISKYKAIYKPLMDCLSCNHILDFCEILGYKVEQRKWRMDALTNYSNNEYDGWVIDATLRVTE